jgi:hypothetical protein
MVSSEHMKRLSVILLCTALVCAACADDRVKLARGPLGPARYEVEARASGNVPAVHAFRRARLTVSRAAGGASVVLRPDGGVVFRAVLYVLEDGTVLLSKVRGAPGGSAGQTDLASLAGQLTPPLPKTPVRLGRHWSSTQKITTTTLVTSLHTVMRIIRFRRMAGTDAAQFSGVITGQLRTTSLRGVFSGQLRGQTEITWAVRAGRVVAADTHLVWTLATGERVTLETRVRPV